MRTQEAGSLGKAKRHLMQVSPRPSMVMTSGEGSWLISDDGTAYLDFVQGRGTNALGHCAPAVTRLVSAQVAKLVHPGSHLYNERSLELARLLAQATGFDQVFFANSGTEANEAAIKLSRKWGRLNGRGSPEILVFDEAFHGRTMGPISAAARPAWTRWFGPLAPGFRSVAYNDLGAARAAFSPEVCAVLVEPVQGEAGVVVGKHEFLQGLRELCDRRGALLIFDEVQTGVGRLGSLFAFQHYGVCPDAVTIGKGLGNGFPIAALLATQAACVFADGEHGGTFNGGPVACAAGIATLSAVNTPAFLQAVRRKGDQLGSALASLVASLGCGQVSGVGLMQRIALDRPVAPLIVQHGIEALRRERGWQGRGLLLNAPRPNILRFLPALNVSDGEIALLLDGLRHSISAAWCSASG